MTIYHARKLLQYIYIGKAQTYFSKNFFFLKNIFFCKVYQHQILMRIFTVFTVLCQKSFTIFNPFVPNGSFLYPPGTNELMSQLFVSQELSIDQVACRLQNTFTRLRHKIFGLIKIKIHIVKFIFCCHIYSQNIFFVVLIVLFQHEVQFVLYTCIKY